jgi:hypothetical protein
MVETVGIEPTASTLARRDRSLAVVPIARRSWSRRDLSWHSAVQLTMCKHIRPQAVLGRDGRIRTPGIRFWRPALCQLSYIPVKLKTARQGFPGGGVRVVLGVYPDAFPLAITAPRRDGMTNCQPQCSSSHSGSSYDLQVFT